MSKRIRIVRDEDCGDPREWDNLGTMACWHPNYTLGDEQVLRDSAQAFVDELPKDCIVLPLYLYDHSGITMRTGAFDCPWDSGQVGIIYLTPEKLREEYKDIGPDEAREQAMKVLESEVKVFDLYLQGACWGFVIENELKCDHCGHTEWEHVDSCFGHLGDDLDETGIADHVGDAVTKEALTEAWDNRWD